MEEIISYNLNLVNLNNRPYIHGTSIVKGILDKLREQYYNITNFEIRLKKKLTTQPILNLSQTKLNNTDAVIVGQFEVDNKIVFFDLVPTENTCTSFKIVNESELEKRIYQTEKFWCIDLNEMDDIHVCLNSLSKFSNYVLFSSLPNIEINSTKQTWFVGYKLESINFLYKKQQTIAISNDYEMITPTCMKRQIYANKMRVGDRITIYA